MRLWRMHVDLNADLGDSARLVRDQPLDVGTPAVANGVQDVPSLLSTGELTLDVVLGPRDDWFSPAAVRVLLESAWQVSSASDRIGVRMSSPTLERTRPEDLPSELCLRGSIQVAPDGQPIVIGPDHPVTGGYPVIAVMVDAHTDRLAQARTGQTLRLRRRPLP